MSQRFWLPALLCSLGACTPPPEVSGDASVDSDGGGPTSEQLRVAWEPRPSAIPGPSSSDATIERVVYRIRDLRVIGDATPSPLPRFALEWAAGVTPVPSAFSDAQLGTYSRLLFSLDPGNDSFAYEISGQVDVDKVRYPYVIRDTQPFSIALDFTITLPPGGAATIPVRVEVDKLVNRVDFRQVTPVGGQRIVDGSSSQLAAVRNELSQAFGVHNDD